MQICQNKCIRFCLSLGNRSHIGANEFKAINWLPVTERFQQCVVTHIFKHKNELAPKHMHEIFTAADQTRIQTRASNQKLIHPHCNKVSGYKTISNLGPILWNKLPNQVKSSNNVNTFKHRIKDLYFKRLSKREDDICFFIKTIFTIADFPQKIGQSEVKLAVRK